jgi:hypothetical protein
MKATQQSANTGTNATSRVRGQDTLLSVCSVIAELIPIANVTVNHRYSVIQTSVLSSDGLASKICCEIGCAFPLVNVSRMFSGALEFTLLRNAGTTEMRSPDDVDDTNHQLDSTQVGRSIQASSCHNRLCLLCALAVVWTPVVIYVVFT